MATVAREAASEAMSSRRAEITLNVAIVKTRKDLTHKNFRIGGGCTNNGKQSQHRIRSWSPDLLHGERIIPWA